MEEIEGDIQMMEKVLGQVEGLVLFQAKARTGINTRLGIAEKDAREDAK